MPWIPFVKTGYLGTNQWISFVNGNGLTAGGGEPIPEIVWKKVSGTSPLSLPDAIANSIKSLVQFGKCATVDGDIYCNNGRLVAIDDELPAGYKRVLGFSTNNNAYWKITDFPLYGSDTLRFSFEATEACNIIGAYSGSASGNNYSLYAAASSNYLRYKNGAYNSAIDFDTRYDVEITPTGSHGMKTDSTWTAQEFTTPTDLCIGTTSMSASSAKLKGKMYGNVEVVGRAKFIPCERVSDNVLGYYDVIGEAFYTQASGYAGAASLGYDHSHETVLSVVGTPEVLTIGTQTAHVENLFEVGGVADEQDIISGTVTRKVEVSVSGGVITLSALATPVTERVTPQPLSTVEGTNTLSWTAEVSGTVKEVEYAYVAPSFEWKTASGAVVSVNDAIAGEVGALTVGINPVQDLHGYSNPWPAGGGINKLPPAGSTTPVTNGNLTVTPYADGHYHIKKTADTSNRGVSIDLSATVDVTTALYFTPLASVKGTGAMICNLRTSGNSGLTSSYVSKESSLCTADGTAARLYFYFTSGTEYEGDVWPMVTPTAVTAWSPYENICPITGHSTVDVWVETTYDPTAVPSVAVPLSGTYYGGTLDVLTGELTVTMGAIDLGSLEWTYSSSANRAYIQKSDMKNPGAGWNKIVALCSAYAIAQIGNNTETEGIGANGNTIYMRDSRFSSAAEYIAGTAGVLFVYELASPVTVQLTPAQVSTLLGTNVIWASGNGEVSVTYRAEVGE